jgi:hypothetical protein
MMIGYDAGPGTFTVSWDITHGRKLRWLPDVHGISVSTSQRENCFVAVFSNCPEYSYRIWVVNNLGVPVTPALVITPMPRDKRE